MENNFIKQNNIESNDLINIREEIEKYSRHWKWFLISMIIFLGLSFLYIKSKVNVFETKASIMVKEDGGASTDLKMFQDLSSLGLGGKGNNVSDEIEILNSRTLTIETVKSLKLNFEVYQKKGLKKVECYNNKPFVYQIVSDKDKFYQLDTILNINVLNKDTFEYQIQESDDIIQSNFGEKIKIKDYEFVLIPSYNVFDKLIDNSFEVIFKNIDSTIEYYNRNTTIAPVDESSNVINLTLNHSIKTKAQLILNTMVSLYNKMSIDDKNQVGLKTAGFIDSRLESVKRELDLVDSLEEKYKKEERITDIGFQAEGFVSRKYDSDRAFFLKETELSLLDYMIENINKQTNKFELLPANIGVENNLQLSNLVASYNELLLARNKVLSSSTELNPVAKNLNNELMLLRDNIKTSLINSKEELKLTLKSINKQQKEIEKRITSIPEQVRKYRTILRRQKVIAELYSYLLEKKEENEISMAVTVSTSKVIDKAYSKRTPLAPNKKIIILAALVIGIIIPFIIIYLRELLDTKFHSRAELEKYVSVPVLGDIPFDKSEEKVIIKPGSRSSSAEAFRLLRTNIDFILSAVVEESKVIFVTSTISGEGKTFVSVNTASSIALTGKKVLLVGMDLRAPKITQYLGLPNRSGVTNYLIGQEDNISDLVFPLTGFENLDILSSGIVPPNPAELLLNKKLEKMFVELKSQYDYIVVDTAPVNLVTDTLMMSDYADMFIYVARANYLDNRMLEVAQNLYESKRLPNMTMLINAMNHERVYGYGGYGYGGYSDVDEKKSFFQKIFKN